MEDHKKYNEINDIEDQKEYNDSQKPLPLWKPKIFTWLSLKLGYQTIFFVNYYRHKLLITIKFL